MTSILFNIKGKHEKNLDEIIDWFNTVTEEGISIERVNSRSLGFVDSLIVTIAGGISVALITRLFDKLDAYKKTKPDHYKITIVEEKSKVSFVLPDQRVECETHFKKTEIEGLKHERLPPQK